MPLFIAVTWLPLLAVAVIARLTTGQLPVEFADFGVHARLLLAVPLFLYAERSLHGAASAASPGSSKTTGRRTERRR